MVYIFFCSQEFFSARPIFGRYFFYGVQLNSPPYRASSHTQEAPTNHKTPNLNFAKKNYCFGGVGVSNRGVAALVGIHVFHYGPTYI